MEILIEWSSDCGCKQSANYKSCQRVELERRCATDMKCLERLSASFIFSFMYEHDYTNEITDESKGF